LKRTQNTHWKRELIRKATPSLQNITAHG